MLIGSEKPLWGEFNKLLYCIVLSTVMPYYKYAYMPIVFVGSRACAANHYVIAQKCPYK